MDILVSSCETALRIQCWIKVVNHLHNGASVAVTCDASSVDETYVLKNVCGSTTDNSGQLRLRLGHVLMEPKIPRAESWRSALWRLAPAWTHVDVDVKRFYALALRNFPYKSSKFWTSTSVISQRNCGNAILENVLTTRGEMSREPPSEVTLMRSEKS